MHDLCYYVKTVKLSSYFGCQSIVLTNNYYADNGQPNHTAAHSKCNAANCTYQCQAIIVCT